MYSECDGETLVKYGGGIGSVRHLNDDQEVKKWLWHCCH